MIRSSTEEKKLRVLALSPSTSARHGIGRFSRETIDGLVLRGVLVDVVVERNDDPSHAPVTIILSGKSIRNIVRNMITIVRIAGTYDLIQAFDGWPYGLYAFAAKLLRGVPYVLSGVGTYTVAPLYNKKEQFIYRMVLQNASAILCISAYTRKEIIAREPKAPAHVVHMGTTPIVRITTEQQAELAQEFPLVHNRFPLLLSVGEIKDRKGQFEVVKALPSLVAEHPTLLYVMIGATWDYEYINKINAFAAEHHIEKNIATIDNATTDAALSFFYQRANVFLLMSNNDDTHHHFEGFGLVFLEAGQFGVPGIGSRNCGIEDAVANGYSGVLVNQRDTKGIEHALRMILTDDTVITREHVQEFTTRFSWNITAEKYHEHYLYAVHKKYDHKK